MHGLQHKHACLQTSYNRSTFQVFQLDISKTLEAYEVEYHILHEEMEGCSSRTPPSSESHEKDKLILKLSRIQLSNDSLKRQKMELLEQLQVLFYFFYSPGI